MSKLVSLQEAAALVRDGQMIALGGNSLNRTPSAFVRELARQGRRGLSLVKTAGAYDIDLLCAAGAASELRAGARRTSVPRPGVPPERPARRFEAPARLTFHSCRGLKKSFLGMSGRSS